MMLQLIMRDVE